MNSDYIISQLSDNASVYLKLYEAIPDELIHWRSSPGKWNMLEIICHLYDEEKEDFRQRLKMVLENPEKTLPAIDPVSWVTNRQYNLKNIDEVLKEFITERKKS